MRDVIYARISDDPTGKAAGVDRQVQECRALAESRGDTVVEVVIDNDLSATKGRRRPGFDRVLELIQTDEVDTVVIWHTDRLYRLPRDLEPIIALAEGRKLKFLTVTASEIDLNNPSGRMVARMLAAASAQEVEHKSERQRSASDQRAERGVAHGSGYGFRRDGDALVVDPAEAAVIQDVVRRVLEGESLRHIAADLTERDVPRPGKGARWTSGTLRQMLLRPSLAGLRKHRGQIVGSALGERVIDLDTRDRLVALLSDPTRKTGTGGRTPKYLGSGLFRCGVCSETAGGKMVRLPGWTPRGGGRGTQPAYACGSCHRVRRLQAPVDSYVEEIVLRRLERDDATELFATGDPAAVDAARGAIAAVDARLATAADLFADGAIDGEQLRRITAAQRSAREQLEVAMSAAMPPAIPRDAVGTRAREVWAALDIERRRAILTALLTVTILPSGPGRPFDPELICIDWLTDEPQVSTGDVPL